MNNNIEVYYEATPNPQTMKFIVTGQISDETVFFEDPMKTQNSPLAAKIFGFPWAEKVLIGPNFVSVSKQEWVEWDALASPLSDLIQEHISSGEAVLIKLATDENSADATTILESDSDVVKQIKTILNEEVRPAVAMDGGDIIFHKYEDGLLHLELLGSCSGCPSSMMTLKEGVENRLKADIPELVEVLPV